MTSLPRLRLAMRPPSCAHGPVTPLAALAVLAACLPAGAAAGQAARGAEVPDGTVVTVPRLAARGEPAGPAADTRPLVLSVTSVARGDAPGALPAADARALVLPLAIPAPAVPEAGHSAGAGAQVSPAPAPGRREPVLRLRAAGTVGFIGFAAADTFKALYGSSTGLTLGGAVQVVHRHGWFAQVDVSHYRATGERVFVSGTDLFRLGIASRVTMTPIEVTGGYRLTRRPRAPGAPRRVPPGRGAATPRRPSRFASLVPYGGAGVGAVRLTERADFAVAGDDVEETHRSYHIVGGVEIPVRGWLAAGVDAGYRWVPGALGSGGVSKEFGETDLGGFVVRARVIVGR